VLVTTAPINVAEVGRVLVGTALTLGLVEVTEKLPLEIFTFKADVEVTFTLPIVLVPAGSGLDGCNATTIPVSTEEAAVLADLTVTGVLVPLEELRPAIC
jgi:hypothetical protein